MQQTRGLVLTLPRLDRIEIRPELRDHVLATLWFICTFKTFQYDELILYPLALYFGWAFIRDFPKLTDLIARSFILFLFPIWYFLTAFWGAETWLILRSGLQIVLTVMICYCVVLRLNPRDVMLSFLIAGTIFAVLSFLEGFSADKAARGVFASKNAMGAAMALLWTTALTVALDSAFSRYLRVFAVGAAMLALFQAFRSDSATAILLILGATGILIGIGIIPRSGVLKRPGFYVFCFMLCAVGAFLMAGILAFDDVNPIDSVLGAVGKDTTLTGRTVLWQYALEEIRQRPLLGLGEGGFWKPYEPFSTAKKIYAEFHKAPYAKFSFHNSYLEIAVHQGLIGAAITVLFVVWAFYLVMRGVLVSNSMPTVFFFCLACVTLVRSMTEPGLNRPFAILPMLFTIGALFEIKRRRALVRAARNGSG